MKLFSILAALGALVCCCLANASALTPAGSAVKLELPTSCAVVIPQNASAQERFGANLLVEYLKPLFGIDAEVVSDAAELSGPFIAIGDTRFSPAPKAFSDQGYELAVADGSLFIQGGGRGVLYGVLAALEEDWGMRHYNQYDAAIVPDGAVLQVTPRAYTPVFEMREPLYQDAWGAPKAREWAGFNRMQPVSYYSIVEPEYGGGLCYPEYFIHTYYDLVPTDKYYDTHPEYFPLRNGKRHRTTRSDGQLCYSNPDLPELIAEQLKTVIAKVPASRVFSVSTNDNVFDNCECPGCTAVISTEGLGAVQMLLANRVAEKLVTTLPDIRITFLAYVGSQEPPKVTLPTPNTVPFYAPIRQRAGALMLLPWTEVPPIVEELTAWSLVADKLYIWDYVDNGICNDLPTPFPNFDAMDRTIHYWVESGVDGVFLEGAEVSRGSLGELKSWYFTKKLWNPAWDTGALIEDFVTGFYGPAAEPMRRYVVLQRDAWERWHDSYQPGIALKFSPEEIQTMRDILAEAMVAAGDDKAVADKIRREQLSVLLTILKGVPQRSNPAPYAEALTEAEALIAALQMEKFGVRTMCVDLVAAWHKKLDEAINGSPLPLYCDDSGVLTVPQVWFGEERPDPAAFTGKAFRQPGTGSDWGLQWDFADLLSRFPNQQVLVARVRAKPELNGNHSPADPFFQLRLWRSGVEATQGVVVPVGSDAGSDYRWHNLFRVYMYSPAAEGTFYTCPGPGLAEDEAVWFDYIEFIPIEAFEDKALAESLPLITL